MSADFVFWLAVVGLVLTCLAAIGARSLAEFSRHELEEICARRNARNRLGQILKQHDQAGLAAETLQVIATAELLTSATFWVCLELRADGPASWVLLMATIGVGAPFSRTLSERLPAIPGTSAAGAEPKLPHLVMKRGPSTSTPPRSTRRTPCPSST